jgi:adenylate cyclase
MGTANGGQIANLGKGRPMSGRTIFACSGAVLRTTGLSPSRIAKRAIDGIQHHARASAVRRITQWLAGQATTDDDGIALLNGLCAALCEQRIPLWRVSVIAPTIDPFIHSVRLDWHRDRGASRATATHDDAGVAGRADHPAQALVRHGRVFARWRLHDAMDRITTVPALHDLRADGGTDFVQHIIWFAPGTALKGVSVSFATDARDGFSTDDLAVFAEILPTLGLAISKLGLSRTLQDTLAIYLGKAAGARVLEGHIQRGEGQTVAAAILIADFRAFTALTEKENPVAVVGWLNEHLDAVGEPVGRHGGEILKFMGDGFLAIFPVQGRDSGSCATCAGALDAAMQAQAANRDLNARRRAQGLPGLDVDLALHFGEVVYGNVGTSRRLDFTVIGRAVNEVSRIEELCEETGRSLLASDSFAQRCGRKLEPVGTFTLRGLQREQRIWATTYEMTS